MDMNIEGRVVAGCGHFNKRMTAYPEVFRRAIGEVFPGTLNVEVSRHVRIREEHRIRGAEINEPGQDLLIERCRINEIPAYWIRPLDVATGAGGHGDNILEIACAEKVVNARPGIAVRITLFRDDIDNP
jgi:CTP-dependent riboflavin kinase